MSMYMESPPGLNFDIHLIVISEHAEITAITATLR